MLIFDNKLDRSELYFSVLQVMRIFGESTRETLARLKTLTALIDSVAIAFESPQIAKAKSDWYEMLGNSTKVHDRLLERMAKKEKEVEGPGDGVRLCFLQFSSSILLTLHRFSMLPRFLRPRNHQSWVEMS